MSAATHQALLAYRQACLLATRHAGLCPLRHLSCSRAHDTAAASFRSWPLVKDHGRIVPQDLVKALTSKWRSFLRLSH